MPNVHGPRVAVAEPLEAGRVVSDSGDAIVRFVNVKKTYDGEALVVSNLNLDVRRGEFLTLLGPSGSGKTTTLMMLAGFETPTNGEILLEGRSINRLPPYKRNIGMVFQNYALFPHMSVWKNLAFPLEARKIPTQEIRRRIGRALSMVRLTGLEDRRPGQLSGGQEQRVALARALVFEPLIVLMDEPLGALDRQLREAMQYEIKHLHESLGVTVIYVTHDQNEALTMSDRIAVFNKGAIQQLASPEDLYEKPKNAFVAQFIGENNRLPGKLKSRAGSRCMVEVGSHVVSALAVCAAGVGEATTLSLRPERVFLDREVINCPNQFTAEVKELIYVGDHLRMRLAVCGVEDFIVKVANSRSHQGISVGDAIRIGWQADDCRALDELNK